MSRRIRSFKNAVVFFVVMFITVFGTLSIIDFLGFGSFAPYVAGVVGGVSWIVGGIVAWRQSRESESNKTSSFGESKKESDKL